MKKTLWLVLLVAVCAQAEVKLPALLSDGAVLQRDLPLHFWGTAEPGEQVTVTFAANSQSAKTDSLGHWNVYLPPAKAGGPFEISIQGSNRIVLHDVMVGDVWLASGQSNMEFPLRRVKDGEKEVAAADSPNIRLFRVDHVHSEFPLSDVTAKPWTPCTPESVREFSAVAYYFAREIAQKEKVTIGVVESSWGGTLAESWTSMDALSGDPALMPLFAARARMMDRQADVPMQLKQEQAERDAAKGKGLPEPKFPWHPQHEMWQPAGLFNGMIAPLTPFPIRGVIWYQGESNSMIERAPYLYGHQFETLIRDWRAHWGEGDFPFLFVQISSYTSTPAEDWPAIREGQRQTLALRNTGMAVSIDIGDPDDVHPLDKIDVGHRLALIARATVYGENVVYSGPTVREITRDGRGLRVWLDHAAGLMAKGTALTGFEIAGTDGKFQAAEAKIDGETLIVSSSAVEHPVSVRYGWANSPQCNLFNKEGLPASPFTASLPPLH